MFIQKLLEVNIDVVFLNQKETKVYIWVQKRQCMEVEETFLKAIGLALGNRQRWGREESVTAMEGCRRTEERNGGNRMRGEKN